MTFPIHIPRVNNNDDEVRLVGLWVSPGEFVKAGTPLADIETGKATVTVEAEKDGYILKLCGASGAIVKVGGVLLWMERAPASRSHNMTMFGLQQRCRASRPCGRPCS